MKPNITSPVGIFGQGLTGKAIFRLLSFWGLSQDDLVLFDEKSLPVGVSLADFIVAQGFKTLVVSPGVPLDKPELQSFREKGGRITSELELAWSGLEKEKVIGVTGSVGKSTVSALLHTGLKKVDPATFLGGNFGFPLADYVADVLMGRRARASWVVLELSSYQLENFASLNLAGGILTSLLSNHLERYPSREVYYNTKWTLVDKTNGPVVLNRSGFDLESFSRGKSHGQLLWADRKTLNLIDQSLNARLLKESPLLGSHNQDNLALAACLLQSLGLADCILEMNSFRGLPHRVENLGEKGGVQIINDSKATTIDSVQQAVATVLPRLSAGKKLYLLLGGKDKNLPWEELSNIKDSRIVPVFFGEYGSSAKTKSKLTGEVFLRLSQAIEFSTAKATKGDFILLSPGGSSLDEFKSFEDRGDFFRSEIARWKPSPE
jgi:UDP-N-acetylmuramoylalanine--D-glutamate ligase